MSTVSLVTDGLETSLCAYCLPLTLAFVLRRRTEGPLGETEEYRIRLSMCVRGPQQAPPPARFDDPLGEFPGLSI